MKISKLIDSAMKRQKAEARAAWSGSGDAATERVWFDIRDALGATEFLGHTTESADGKIVALVADGKQVDSLAAGQEGAVLVNQTPFYGESGGQMGDSGALFSATGAELHKHYVPGTWLPHCSLAPRATLAQLPAVVAAVFDVLPLRARLDRAALVNNATGELNPLPVLP